MFWKSLDHQAVNAKSADKRQFQTKTLISEIQTKYEEQKRQRMFGASVEVVSKAQMEFDIKDTEVLVDATYLVLTYAEHTQSTEYPRLTSFIKEFVPMFFGLEVETFNAQIRNKMGDSPAGEIAEDTMSAFDDPLGARGRKATGKKDDLRRGVLDRGHKGGRKEDGSATPISRASTPDNASRADEDMSDSNNPLVDDASDTTGDLWAEYPAGFNNFRNRHIAPTKAYYREEYHLYGNNSIYCFLRMLLILYERLHNLKKSEDIVREEVKRAMAPKPAIDLGLVDRLPTDFFGDVSLGANYYQQVLVMFEDLVKNDMDMAHIEETLRRYYLQYGWQLYSVDKLLQSLVRFATGIMSSDSRERSFDILQLFKKDRTKQETTHSDEMTYRKNVEKLVKDGDIYRIAYVSPLSNLHFRTLLTISQNEKEQRIKIKIFKKDEPTFDSDQLMDEDKWRVYLAEYLSTGPTHGAPLGLVGLPVLKRNVRILSKDGTVTPSYSGTLPADALLTGDLGRRYDLVRAKENLEFRISVGNYKLCYQINSDEYWHQPWAVRVGGRAGADEAAQTVAFRADRVGSVLVQNNAAVRALGAEHVEGKIEEWATLRDRGVAALKTEDESMVDA